MLRISKGRVQGQIPPFTQTLIAAAGHKSPKPLVILAPSFNSFLVITIREYANPECLYCVSAELVVK